MNIELLVQADYALSRCGRPIAPPGLSVVPWFKAFRCWAVFAAPGATTVAVPTTVTGDTDWALRSISSSVPLGAGLSLQFQFLDGRTLVNSLADIGAIQGTGPFRFAFTKERVCPPGTKITAFFENTTPAQAQAVPLLLEGAYLFHLKGSRAQAPRGIQLASDAPRFVAGENQNILAPASMAGVYPAAPMGCVDSEYVYGPNLLSASNPGVAAVDVGALTPKDASVTIQLDNDAFRVRRMGFAVFQGSGQGAAAGTFLVKPRAASGHLFADDYVRADFINGVRYPKDWTLAGRDQVIFDFTLVDFSGAGILCIAPFLEGIKRRRA